MKKFKKILVSGYFNIIHPGHIRLLKFANDLCEDLYVCIYPDKGSNGLAKINENLRLENIKSLSFVTKAFICENNIKSTIRRYKPDAVVKGFEWNDKFNEEEDVLKEYGAKLIFSSGDSFIKSSDLIKDHIFHTTISEPKEFLRRNNIKLSKIIENIKALSNLKIAVFGDLIIDRYIQCHAVGMSQEDSSLVYKPLSKMSYLGGAGIVAAHAKSFSNYVDFYSVIGKDILGKEASILLKKYNLSTSLVMEDQSRPTIIKDRYIQNSNTVFRLSEYLQFGLDKKIFNQLKKNLLKKINNYDLIILSDFNYGLITDDLIKMISSNKLKSTVVVADCQSSSQFGNILKFNNIDILTPTEYEARTALFDNDSGLIELCNKIYSKIKVKNILLKMGADGVLSYSKTGNKISTEQLNALNNDPINISGAGDSLMVLASMYYTLTKNINEAILLGSISSAIQVSREGNIPITPIELSSIFSKWMH